LSRRRTPGAPLLTAIAVASIRVTSKSPATAAPRPKAATRPIEQTNTVIGAVIRQATRILFSLPPTSSGDPDAYGFQKFVEIVGDGLIEPVQLGTLLVGEFAISRHRLQ